MTKKLLITLFILALFASCGTRSNVQQQTNDYACDEIIIGTFSDGFVRRSSIQGPTPANPNSFDIGVVINDVRWATRNVNMPGRFTRNLEDAGMFFQWGRRKGWAITGDVEDWDDFGYEGEIWKQENDPCPRGWRVPTKYELRSLIDAGSEFAIKNDVRGLFFGTAPNQIFLPVAGFRWSAGANSVFSTYTDGIYQSSTTYNNDHSRAWTMNFVTGAEIYESSKASAFSIRCVSIN